MLFEQVHALLAIRVIVLFFDRVRYCLPLVRAQHSQLHLCLEAWLIKAREHLEAVINFELGVKILIVVLGVCERVKTRSVLVVGGEVAKHHCVPAQSKVGRLQSNFLFFKGLATFLFFVVDHELTDCHGLRAQEELLARRHTFKIEVYHSLAQVVVAFLKGELEVILDVLDEFTASAGLLLGKGGIVLELLIDNGIWAQMLGDKLLLLL